MAYALNLADQYLYGNAAPASSAPLTLFARTNPTVVNTGQVVLSVGTSGTGTHRWALAHSNQGSGQVAMQAISSGSAAAQSGASAVTAGSWQSCVGVEDSSASREVLVDAVSKATDGTSSSPTGTNAIYVGVRNSNGLGFFAGGAIADVAVWNVALTDAEIASLAKGFSPRRIRPQSLVFYAPLLRNLQDLRRGLALTAVNSPTVANHPRVY